MSDSNTEELEDSPEKAPSPLDIRALLWGTLKRWPIVVIVGALAFVGGNAVSGKIGKKAFEAETTMRFEPTGENSHYIDQKTAILTIKETVKIRENVEEMRERLGLKEDLGKIGKALDIRVQKNTTLLIIGAKWPTARGAAEIVNTLRDVFLENYDKKRKNDIRRQMSDFNLRLAVVRANLRNQDRQLQLFTTSNRIVDIEKQSRALLEEYNNYGVLLEQAVAQKAIVDQQSDKLGEAINELKRRVARESKSMAQLENLADVNTRIDRIQATIREDKDTRINIAELALRKQEMDRVKRLYDKGFASEMEYQRVVTAYETQRIKTEDTEESRRMREERARLQEQIIPREGGNAPSSPILADMMKRTFDIELERISVSRKVQSLQEARQRVKLQLDKVPVLQQQFEALQRNITAGEQERKEIEGRVAIMQRDLDSRMVDFTLVSVAEVDKEADNAAGKTKLIGILVGLFGTIVGIALAGGWGLLDKTVRSPQQAGLKLAPLPLLGTLPQRRGRHRPLLASPEEKDFSERLSVTAKRLRRATEGRHCLLIVAATNGEGVGTVARNLAAALARQEERALLVDLRPDALEEAQELIKDSDDLPRLSSYLEGEKIPAEALVRPLLEGKLGLLMRDTPALSPDRLGSQRLASLLRNLGANYEVTLLAAASPLESTEAELLANAVDGAIIVVRAGKTSTSQIQKAIKKLESVNVPILGVVLNGATKPYINWE